MRRRHVSYAPLTSLLDVLFLLLFAALVQSAALVEEADARREPIGAEVIAESAEAPVDAAADAAVDAGVRDAAAAPRRVIYERALSAVEDRLRRGPAVFVYVAGGVITAVEVFRDSDVERLPVGWSLVLPSPDPDVVLEYVGDRDPRRQLCAAVSETVPDLELASTLIVIAPEASLGELPVAVAEGLMADQRRCAAAGATAVIVPSPDLANREGTP